MGLRPSQSSSPWMKLSASTARRGCRGAQVATDGAAIADLWRTDRARGHGEAWKPVTELVDEPRVRYAGADAQRPVERCPFPQLGNPGQIQDRRGPVVVEVDLDHHVRAAGDRHRVWMFRLHLERLVP